MELIYLSEDVVLQHDIRFGRKGDVNEIVNAVLDSDVGDQEIVCLAGKNGKRYSLNLTGFLTLQILRSKKSIEQLVAELDDFFSYPDRSLLQDEIESFVVELIQCGLISTESK